MLTINEAMVLQKAVKTRLNDLKELRDEVAFEETTSYPLVSDTREKVVTKEVKYDVKKVDRKITELELFLFKLDSKIKQSNAITKIDIEANIDELLSPLE